MHKNKKISIVTTIKHNIGDDFVREGIVSLLSDINKTLEFDFIHKHSPVTSYYGFEKIRHLRVSNLIEPALRFLGAPNRVDGSDILIQSGAPVYWCHHGGPHCADNEWFDPLIRRTFSRNRRTQALLNIAGGSCQRYHSDGTEVSNCPQCKSYIAEFFDACNLTILRDKLAKKMLNIAGRDASVLPCTSIFARDYFQIQPAKGEYIVVNYMKIGGHYSFGQSINTEKWKKSFIEIVAKLKPHGRVIAACHTDNELQLVNQILPDLETYIVPNDHIEFMKFYSRARFAVVNRVHAGFMMASFGKPAVIIGNDTRALMIENLNLSSYFVDDVCSDLIDSMIDGLLQRESIYREEIEVIRRDTRKSYIEKIAAVL